MFTKNINFSAYTLYESARPSSLSRVYINKLADKIIFFCFDGV